VSAMKKTSVPDPQRWQGLAKGLVPEVYDVLLADEEWNHGCSKSLMQFFFVFLPMVRDAHRAKNEALLYRAHAFADWCMRQPEQDIWNPAGVAFYEHIFDECPASEIVPWISAKVFSDIASLLDWRLGQKKSDEIKKAFKSRKSANEVKYPGVIALAERQSDR
jgi:hypothetical protein